MASFRRIGFIAVSVLSLFFPAMGWAQWIQTGGPRVTWVYSSVVSETNLYAGTESGVFRSTDSGATWMASNSGIPSTHAFTVMGTKLYAGTDGGAFLSTDSGVNWIPINSGIRSGASVYALGVNGKCLFAGTAGMGIFRSLDSGESWIAIDSGLTDSNISALAVSGTNLFVGTNGGVFLSTDSGSSWNSVDSGLVFTWGIQSFAVMGTNVFVDGGPGNVYRTTNNGARWTPMRSYNTALNDGVFALAVSGTSLFAGTGGSGVYSSPDSGTSWTSVGLSSGPYNTVYTLAVSATNIFAGTEGGGVWRRSLSDFGKLGISYAAPSLSSFTTYPNPFTDRMTITLSATESGVAEISVVNLLGEEVARIFDGEFMSGSHSFTWDARGLAPGMYECALRMNGKYQESPIVLTK